MKVWDGRARNTIDAGVVCVSVRSQLAVGGSSALRPQSRTRGWEVGLDWGRGEGRILMLDSRRQSSVSRSSFEFRNERQKLSTWRGERERKKGKATVTERMVHAHLLQCDAATSVGACRVQPCNPAVVPGRSPPAPWWSRVRGTSYWALVPGPGFVARMGEVALTSSRGYLESTSLLLHRHIQRDLRKARAGPQDDVPRLEGGSLTRGGERAALVFSFQALSLFFLFLFPG